MKHILAGLPFLAGMSAIWLVSSMERPPVPEELVFWNSDKLLHAGAYALLAVLATPATWTTWGPAAKRHGARRAIVVSALLASLYGVVDEVHQSFVPGRSSSIADVVADTLGAFLGAWLAGSALVVLRRARRGEVRE